MKYIILSITLVIVLASNTSAGNNLYYEEITEWNFIILMCADNDLADYLYHLQDINELEVIGSSNKIRVLVVLDLRGDNDTVLYLIERDYAGKDAKIRSPIVERLGELDFSDATALNKLLLRIMRQFPSKFLALVFWGHGAFYKGIFDDKGRLLGIERIKDVIDKFKADVIVFDACRMGSVEILYAARNLCDYMVATENDFIGDGLPYDIVLEKLNNIPKLGAREFCTAIVESFSTWIKNNVVLKSVVLSAYNVTKFRDDYLKLFEYIRALNESLPLMKNEIREALKMTEKYEGITNGDLIDFISNVESCGDIRLRYLSSSIKDIVKSWIEICYKHSYGEDVARANGLAIYVPEHYVDPYYSICSFGIDSGWQSFLNRLLSIEATSIPITVTVDARDLVVNISVQSSIYDFYEIYISGKEIVRIISNSSVVTVHLSEYGRYRIDVYGFINNSLYGHWYDYIEIVYLVWINVSVIVSGVVPDIIFIENEGRIYFPTNRSNSNDFVFILRAPLEIELGKKIKIIFYYYESRYEYEYEILDTNNKIKILEYRDGIHLSIIFLVSFITLLVSILSHKSLERRKSC